MKPFLLLVLTALVAASVSKEATPAAGTVFATTFSNANPGAFVLFDPTSPNVYTKQLASSAVEGYDGIAANSNAHEAYLIASSGLDTWLDIYDTDTLQQKGDPIFLNTVFSCTDYHFDRLLAPNGLLFGVFPDPDDNKYAIYEINRENGTLTQYFKPDIFRTIVGMEDSASAYDDVRHRYFFNADFADQTCGWVVLDLLNKVVVSKSVMPFKCSKNPNNVEYLPSEDKLLAITDSADAWIADPYTGNWRYLFNISVAGEFRVLGTSMVVAVSEVSSVYYTQLMTHAPVQTRLVAITLTRNFKPVFKSFEPNPAADIIGQMVWLQN